MSEFASTGSTGLVAGVSEHETRLLKAQFESGEFEHDSKEAKQIFEVIRVMVEYRKNDALHAIKYASTHEMHRDKITPYKYIKKRLSAVAVFRHDEVGATNAIKRAMRTLTTVGAIKECERTDMIKKYGTSQKAYTFAVVPILR